MMAERTILNIGIPIFYEALKDQHVPCAQVKWEIPARGNTRLLEIIDKLYEREAKEEN